MDFSKLKSLVSNDFGYNKNLTSAKPCSQYKNDCNQQDNTTCSQYTHQLATEKYIDNQQCITCSQYNQSERIISINKKEVLSYNLKENNVIEDSKKFPREAVEKSATLATWLQSKKEDITTKEKDFDLFNLFIPVIHEKSVANRNDTLATLATSPFDELGYVSDEYDHLSEQSSCVQVEAVTPQQVLGIVETGLERKVFDHLKRYGACQLKTVAKEMNQNEQAIRQVVQNSTLVEYRKGVDECGAWESLLPNEIDYPARFVAFIESQEKIENDDVFVLLEQCEAYIRQHDQEYLKEWLDFFSRVVRFYHVDIPLLTSLRDACRFRDTENAIWV